MPWAYENIREHLENIQILLVSKGFIGYLLLSYSIMEQIFCIAYNMILNVVKLQTERRTSRYCAVIQEPPALFSKKKIFFKNFLFNKFVLLQSHFFLLPQLCTSTWSTVTSLVLLTILFFWDIKKAFSDHFDVVLTNHKECLLSYQIV